MTIATRNAFLYGMTESLGETAIAATLTAARWGVLAWDVATSDEARQTYRWAKEITIALGQLAFWSVVWAYAKTSAWAEAEVQSCLSAEADIIVMVDWMAAATLVVPVAKAQPVTSAELRRQCQSAGIKWRNAHGKGRHLSKSEMVEALNSLDCWALSEDCLA